MNISSLCTSLVSLNDSELYQKIRDLRALRRQLKDPKVQVKKDGKKTKKKPPDISKMSLEGKKILLNKLLKMKANRG